MLPHGSYNHAHALSGSVDKAGTGRHGIGVRVMLPLQAYPLVGGCRHTLGGTLPHNRPPLLLGFPLIWQVLLQPV